MKTTSNNIISTLLESWEIGPQLIILWENWPKKEAASPIRVSDTDRQHEITDTPQKSVYIQQALDLWLQHRSQTPCCLILAHKFQDNNLHHHHLDDMAHLLICQMSSKRHVLMMMWHCHIIVSSICRGGWRGLWWHSPFLIARLPMATSPLLLI